MEHLLNYFKYRKKALSFLLRYSKRKFSKKAFHRFRVEVKRLQALLFLLQCAEPSFDAKSAGKPIQKLFKKAGPIREMQLEKDLLTEYKIVEQVPKLKSQLNNEIQKKRKEFFKSRNLSKSKKIQKRFKRIQKLIKKKKSFDFTLFIEDLWEEILQMMAKGIRPENAHLLRKKLKNYHYSLEILGKGNFPIHIPQIEELIHLLGEWHDRDDFLTRVEKENLTSQLTPEEEETFREFVNQVRRDSSEIFQIVGTKLSQIQ